MSSKDDILALINANNPNNPNPLTSDAVDVSLPAVDTDDIVESDTVVTITPKNGSGYEGSVTVHYHRNSMHDITTPTTLQSEDPFTPEMVLAMLNEKRGSHIQLNEVEPITIPPMDPGTSATITITASAESYGWTGSMDVDLVYGIPSNSDTYNTTMNNGLPS